MLLYPILSIKRQRKRCQTLIVIFLITVVAALAPGWKLNWEPSLRHMLYVCGSILVQCLLLRPYPLSGFSGLTENLVMVRNRSARPPVFSTVVTPLYLRRVIASQTPMIAWATFLVMDVARHRNQRVRWSRRRSRLQFFPFSLLLSKPLSLPELLAPNSILLR